MKYFLNNALSLLSVILYARNSINIVHNKDLFLDCDTILYYTISSENLIAFVRQNCIVLNSTYLQKPGVFIGYALLIYSLSFREPKWNFGSRFSNRRQTCTRLLGFVKTAEQLNNLMAPRRTIGINLNADEPRLFIDSLYAEFQTVRLYRKLFLCQLFDQARHLYHSFLPTF